MCSAPQTLDSATGSPPGLALTCLRLAKPGITALVTATAAAGYALAGGAFGDGWTLAVTLVGTAFAAGGANAANQWIESGRDGRMVRTCGRPFPAGYLCPVRGILWTVAATVVGVVVLAVGANATAAVLAATAAGAYLFLYTPLKPRTTLCTLVGAVSGAIPPLIGWAAAAGRLDLGAWLLGAVLYVWQVPHFLSLAWFRRTDYADGGFRMLPAADPSGDAAARAVVLYTAALVPLSLTLALVGVAGRVYAIGALLLGAGLLLLAVRLYRHRTDANARRLFRATIAYLPLMLTLAVADHM